MTYTFDGSLNGLLTAVFHVFDRKEKDVVLIEKKLIQPGLFDSYSHIVTDEEMSGRVWKKMVEVISKGWRRKLYCAYLSEDAGAHQSVFNTLVKVFSKHPSYINNYGDKDIITVSQCCLLYTSPSPRDRTRSRMPSSA